MVRVKHRYLLLDILYPDPSSWPSSTAPKKAPLQTQSQLRIHSPTSNALTPSLLAKTVREGVADLFGDWGVGRLGGVGAGGVSVKYLSPATSTAIIRCPRASYRLVWMALTYMSCVPEIEGSRSKWSDVAMTRPCVFRVVRVSGTMRKAEEEAIRRARREIVRLRGAEEAGVLGNLVGGLEYEGGSAVVDDVMENEEEDVDMGSDEED
ncbi:Rpp14/Pop5 family-domain-containing protein [Aspergillus coremiiformis]|uniref:Ribonuclease P/MRP protein subunit POP5 n=1 Tax=Aspergillus coremiiformis TaxID=138285 RepID=A0A5N6ZFF4_9EURO|nr:Rpp14/Pop5 family-domain-containing protein [Aspergillus coremiiformis]